LIVTSMEHSPRRSFRCSPLSRKLYRIGTVAVIWTAAVWCGRSSLAAQVLTPQFGHKAAASKGPRAVGLIQLPAKPSPKGDKGRIIPIAIMTDGKFYDAGSYKAAPVPMALDFGIVYEGFRSGVSQGVFTITQPGQLNHVWIAEGKWLPAGAIDPNQHKKYSTPVIEDTEGPPVLHRHGETGDSDSKNKDKDKGGGDQQKPAAAPAPPAAAPTTGAAPASTATPPTPPSPADSAKATAGAETAKASPPAAAPTTSSAPPSVASSDETIDDPNRPRLRRGKPESTAHQEPFVTFDPLLDTTPAAASGAGKAGEKTAKDSAAASPQSAAAFVFIPAISDAGGPDPRPYTYDVKPAEEAGYRSRMLDLAATLLRAQRGAAPKEAGVAPKKSSSGKATGKSSKAAFDDVSLRILDLSNSNEPVLVLSAKTRPSTSEDLGPPKEITLIARTNLEDELKKLFFSETDTQHLDVTPRMELIDAVDADGDGRGELLFRRTFDSGSAYAIYRVTADGLWPLFEGTP
jgi:hypothetical protein